MLDRAKLSIFRFAVIAAAAAFAFCPESAAAQQRRKASSQRTAPPPQAQPAGTQRAAYKGIWEPINYGQDLTLTDVFFVNADVGYVSAAAGSILKTSDSGATWAPLLGGDPQSQERPIDALRFLDQTHGWAMQGRASGFPAKLLGTSDGQNWEQLGMTPPLLDITDYAFTSPTSGLLLTANHNGSTIYRTLDGGRTWKEAFPFNGCHFRAEVDGLAKEVVCFFIGLQMVSPSVGYAIGASDVPDSIVVAKTTDGGITWSLIPSRAPGPLFGYPALQNYYGFFFRDESQGLLTTSNGSCVTTDGGRTWRGLPVSLVGETKFADPEVGWALDHSHASVDYALKYTGDGGARWASRSFHFPAVVHGFSLPRRDRGYIVGDHGMVYRYRVVPSNYQPVAHSLDAPVMPGIDSPVPAEVATLNDLLNKLRTQLPAPASGQDGASGGGFQQDTSATPGSGGGASVFQQDTSTSNTGTGTAPGSTGSGGFQQDTGAEPVAGGYVDSCCAPLIQQLETTVNAFVADVPSFSRRFRNLNLIFQGLRLLNDIVNQANSLKESIRTLREAKNAEAAAAALNQISKQVDTIFSAGGFAQNTVSSLER